MRSSLGGMLCCVGVVVCATAGSVRGDLTPINDSGEPNHVDILDAVYGGDFAVTAPTGSYTNGAVTATRIDDDDDQWFSGGLFEVEAVAKFAYFGQVFGFFPQENDDFQPILGDPTPITTDGYAQSASDTVEITTEFRWGRRGGGGTTVSSDPGDNPGDRDHFVTYQITGLPNQTQDVWLIFVEDKANGDYDFNDLVVQITNVPEPGVLAIGAVLAAPALLYRRRRTA